MRRGRAGSPRQWMARPRAQRRPARPAGNERPSRTRCVREGVSAARGPKPGPQAAAPLAGGVACREASGMGVPGSFVLRPSHHDGFTIADDAFRGYCQFLATIGSTIRDSEHSIRPGLNHERVFVDADGRRLSLRCDPLRMQGNAGAGRQLPLPRLPEKLRRPVCAHTVLPREFDRDSGRREVFRKHRRQRAADPSRFLPELRLPVVRPTGIARRDDRRACRYSRRSVEVSSPSRYLHLACDSLGSHAGTYRQVRDCAAATVRRMASDGLPFQFEIRLRDAHGSVKKRWAR